MESKSAAITVAALALAAMLAPAHPVAAQAWKPDKAVEIIKAKGVLTELGLAR